MSILSIPFFIIYICFCLIYWRLRFFTKTQNLFLLIANYAFYASINWKFCLLLLFTTLSTYVSSLLLCSHPKYKRTILVCDVIIIIGILFLFKYYNFFAGEVAKFLGLYPYEFYIELILPVGISFYCFTAIGALIDIYRNMEMMHEVKLIPFMTFISFFPLLTSGPIERSSGLLAQIRKSRQFDTVLITDGIIQISWGIFKKIVLADNCSIIANNAFGNYSNLPASSLAIGAMMYSFQIYFDFSGYSDIAIGISKTLGFKIRRNFHFPYFALNVADFWKRWHMSLQSWFVDYIYIPLGGSRKSTFKTIMNTFVVFLICGIWHGANWTFIVWGIYHAVLFVPLILIFSKKFRKSSISDNTILPTFKEFALIISNFILITIGWIIFNSKTLNDAFAYINNLFSVTLLDPPSMIGLTDYPYILFLVCLVIIIEWIQKSKEYALQFYSKAWIKVAIIYIIIIHAVLCSATQSDFIYYQF